MSAGGPGLPFHLLAIGDRALATPASVAAASGAGGAALAVLLRDARLTSAERARWAEEVLPACRAAGSLLLVHGDVDAALAAGAHGAHLPGTAPDAADARTRLPAGSLLGVSCHGVAEVEAAARVGADYVTLSPVYATPGKGAPLGPGAFGRIARTARVPVVALGGVSAARVGECREAGAAAVAAIRAVWKGDVAVNVRSLLRA